MAKKINAGMMLMGVVAFLLTLGIALTSFYATFQDQVYDGLEGDAHLIAQSYAKLDSVQELAAYASAQRRITLVAPDGSVLFESGREAAGMENHLQREEVSEALDSGSGQAMRKSATLGYNTYYYALRLDDGNVLRVSMQAVNLLAILRAMLPGAGFAAVLVLAVSVLLSMLLSNLLMKRFSYTVEHLDEYDKKTSFPELAPVVEIIRAQRLEQSENERIRQEFTANVSHELKTPLTSISGYAEMIENGMARAEDIKGFAGKIHGEAGRLITLIGDIMKLSELDSVSEVVQEPYERVDLFRIVKESAAALELPASRESVEITFSGSPCYVMGSAVQLQELVYNLCDNAIRYNKPGGKVHMRVARRGDAVELRVSDTGIGIACQHHARIFERFYRVDKSHSKKTGGTGLGLAIVKHVAIRHDAAIAIDSYPGRGTTVTVTFKAA
ncbi:MAG: sensor histidine kinase [Christensenellales bacterium]|jgi:two-component system phosphate regulon sensor histidine kinase PhoR